MATSPQQPEKREVTDLKINTLTQAKYTQLTEQGLISEDELYMVIDDNFKTQYGDLFGNITDQKDLYDTIASAGLQAASDDAMCKDVRGYNTVKRLKDSAGEPIAFVDNAVNTQFPYYQSVDGAKIVDVRYKQDVDLYYRKTGKGNFIIIDEANQSFRLPRPDIYSIIEKNVPKFVLRKWKED